MSEPEPPEAERPGQRLVAFFDTKPVKSGDRAGVEQLPVARASNFDLGGPAVTKVVYVTHPSSERRLIPFADFDEELARDRLNEALRVFTSLGASRIVATSNRSDRKSSGVNGKLFGAHLGFTAHHDSSSALEVDQRGTGGPARDPRPLRYPDEPGLESACDVVLKLGGRHCKIKIERTTQYGIDGELGARLKKAGFKLGISGSRTQTSVFVIEAVFGRDAASELDMVVNAAADGQLEAKRSARWLRRGGGHG